MTVARLPEELPRPRSRRRDRHVRRRPPRAPRRHPRGGRCGPRADGRHVPPAPAHRAREPGRAALDARAAARAARARRRRRRLVVDFTSETWRRRPRLRSLGRYLTAIGTRVVVVGKGSASAALVAATSICCARSVSTRGSSPARRCVVVAHPALTLACELTGVAGCGRPFELDGIVVSGDPAASTLGSRPRISVSARISSCRASASTRGRGRPTRRDLDRGQPPLRRLRAADRGLSARLGRRSLRRPARVGAWRSASATSALSRARPT